MRIRIIKSMGFCMIATVLAIGGYNINMQNSAEVRAATIESTEESAEKVPKDFIIAIVNLDEGIVENEEKLIYGSVLIESVREDIEVTGLEAARQGIESGKYGAYIIIPNTFSEHVATINDQPEKSKLTYAIGTEVEGTDREKVLEDIVNIYNTFSNGLSKIYTSSLIKEYHEVQDAANEIMERDAIDMEKLLAVNGYDLVEIIEMPELETVKRDIEDLDLSDNYQSNTTGISNIGNAYQNFIQNGENNLSTIKGNAKTVQEKEKTTQSQLKAVTEKVNKINIKEADDTKRAVDEDTRYEENKSSIVGKEGIVEAHNQYIDAFNMSVTEQDKKHRAVMLEYEKLRNDMEEKGALIEVKSANIEVQMDNETTIIPAYEYVYKLCTKETDIDQIEQTVAYKLQEIVEIARMEVENAGQEEIPPEEEDEEGEAEETGEEDIPPSSTSMSEILLGQELNSEEEYRTYVREMLGEVAGTWEQVSALAQETEIAEPQIIVDNVATNKMPQINGTQISTKIDEVIDVAKSGRTARNDEYSDLATGYKTDVTTIQGQVSNINTAYGDEETAKVQLMQGIAGFSLSSYINEDEINGYMADLQSNNQSISEKVSKNNESYENYTQKVYEATNNNIAALKQNIAEGQKASEMKLEENLSLAKASRMDSNEKNILTLKDFGARLAYTRIGELENKKVYDFIAEPIVLENQSKTAKIVKSTPADSSVTKPFREVVTNTNNKMATVPGWAIGIGIGVILLTIGVVIVKRLLDMGRHEEF